jgi:predicted nuclease of predicted toxin-antitoxin system
MRLLAYENFPLKTFQLFKDNGYDIEHIRFIKPSSPDTFVMEYAISQNQIVLTFDSDFGTLVFQKGYKPLGIVFYRLTEFDFTKPFQIFINIIENGFILENNFTVIEQEGIRQRPIIS